MSQRRQWCNPGIGSASSKSDTSMAAEELGSILQAASEVVLHTRNLNVTSGSVQSSPKSDTSSMSTDSVSNVAESEETLYSSIWAPGPRGKRSIRPLGRWGKTASPSFNPQAAPFEPGRLSTPTKIPRRKRARRRPWQTGSEYAHFGARSWISSAYSGTTSFFHAK